MELADYLDMLEPGSAGARRTALSAWDDSVPMTLTQGGGGACVPPYPHVGASPQYSSLRCYRTAADASEGAARWNALQPRQSSVDPLVLAGAVALAGLVFWRYR